MYCFEGYVLAGADKRCLGLGIAHGLDAAVPLDAVDAEYGLRQREGNRHRHKAVVARIFELLEEVERRVERQLAAGEPYVLGEREFAVGLQIVVAHEAVGAGIVHIRRILLAVGGEGGVEGDFRQQLGAVGAVFPVGLPQAVERHCGVDASGACPGDGLAETDAYSLAGHRHRGHEPH